MTVLSDKTIKKMIEGEELVSNGNPDNVTQCSYEFTAALMLKGGEHKIEPVIEPGVAIEPAQLVWVRAKEGISVPENMVGLWIQTQTLARKGLLLLNISLIEPGYKGPVSAVLVNFGNQKVIISPDTKIAKVIFLSLDNDATNPVGEWDSTVYDTKLLKMAANAPKTFLQLQSFLPDIEEKIKARLMAMDKEIELNVGNVANEVKFKLEKELGEKMKRSFFKGHIGLFGSFVIVLGAFLFVITTFLPRLAAEYSRVEELAQKASMVQQAETITGFNAQLKTQAAEIISLKKQLNELKTSKNDPPSQIGTLPDSEADPNR